MHTGQALAPQLANERIMYAFHLTNHIVICRKDLYLRGYTANVCF
jgi:hypothetical protein